MTQHSQQFIERRRQPFARGHSQHCPADPQCRDDVGPYFTGRGGECMGDDLGLERRCGRLAGMVSVPPGVGAQLVENPSLTALTRQPVAGAPSRVNATCCDAVHSASVRGVVAVVGTLVGPSMRQHSPPGRAALRGGEPFPRWQGYMLPDGLDTRGNGELFR
jgi:hypothetical protein